MPGRVQDKVAIVTGAGTGIGRGIAVMLAREGARVVVANRSAQTGEETVRLAREAGGAAGTGGTAVFQATDVTREAECQTLAKAAVAQFGSLDVLVNNAGIFPRATLEETTEELWDRIFAVNLKGVFFCCKHSMPVMRERGGGSVVNIGSINAYVGDRNLFPYSVSKGGLLTLTRNLAASWAMHRVRVNFLNPGWVITPGEIHIQGIEGHDLAWLEQQAQRMPLGRMQTPEDAAWAALYLASDESAMVTGQALNVDGGKLDPMVIPLLDAAQPALDAQRPSKEPRARLVEVFSSIQGEAELVGYRQIFVRTFGCNLRCSWCDSPETLFGHPPARFEQTPGHRDFVQQPNPVTLETALEAVRRLNRVPHHSVSLTGGEPLLHARFLQRFLPELRVREGLPLYLETNGLLPGHLEQVIELVDIIGMDLKPPSCTDDPLADWLERHRQFLAIAQRKRVFLKLVVGPNADTDEMEAAFRMVAEQDPALSLTLQPVTPFGPVQRAPTDLEMLRWHELASRHLSNVRIIPQVHKFMGLL